MPTDLSIGKLENHLHDVFAANRVPGADFVYVAEGKAMNMLESYSDDGPEERTPILFLGEAGAGKSALLANWLNKRVMNNKRSRGNEFIFWHAVGSSRQSMSVNSFLRRLMNGLKEEFELPRQVTLDEDRLSWDLPLFLDQAAKKGKIIIVIDGLHRMVNEGADGGMNLTWLPLSFPNNVRLIMTSAAPPSYFALGNNDGEDTPRKPPIILEIERRNWQIILMPTHDVDLSKKIVHNYIKVSVKSDAEQLTAGPFLTALDDTGRSSKDTPGLMLFESHIENILTHSCGVKPMFLRLVLRLLRWTMTRNYSLWHVFDKWMRSDDIEDLLHAVLSTVEKGYSRTIEGVRECRERTMSSGGMGALRTLYPWHPNFMELDKDDDENHRALEMEVDFRGSNGASAVAPHMVRGKTLILAKNTGASSSISIGRGKTRVQPLTGNQNTTSTVNIGHTSHKKDPIAKKNTIMQSLGDQRWQSSSDDADMHLDMAMLEMTKELQDTVSRSRRDFQQELEDESTESGHKPPGSYIDIIVETMHEMHAAYANLDLMERCPAEHVDMDYMDSDDDEDNSAGEDESGDDGGDGLISRRPSGENPDVNRDTMRIDEDEDDDHKKAHAHKKHKHRATTNIDLLPEYLLGGGPVDGFGQIVGDALALLYVARHGLTENELWSILQKISEEKASALQERTVDDDARTLIAVCYGYRGQMEDMFRAADDRLTGLLSKGTVSSCLSKINAQFDKADLRLLLALTNAKEDERGFIYYMDLIKRVEKVERGMKHNEARMKLLAGQIQAEDDMSGMDTMTGQPQHTRLVGADWDEQSLESKRLPAIGPLMEEALLSFLVALGVLRSAENHVLVLPFDNESLRKMVYDRYIAPRAPNSNKSTGGGGMAPDDTSVLSEGMHEDVVSTVASIADENQSGTNFWHSKLIDYFTTQPICLRRCEELLWHLKICRRWHFLKDVLADQYTFDIMFGGEMRDEYMNYWVLLTEGPLYTSDSAMRRGQDKNNLTENKKILADLDTAAALGLTDKEMRKAILKSRISCFDVVEEFHRSFDTWCSASKADLHARAVQVEKIANFMSEFSRKTQMPPIFSRIVPNLPTLLNDFGCSFSELEIPELTDDDDHSPEALEAHEATKAQHVASRYLYRRWMWAQFPVISLRFVSDGARQDPDSNNIAHLEESTMNSLTSDELKKESSDVAIGDQTFMRNFNVKKSDPNRPPIFHTSAVRLDAMVKNCMTPVAHMEALANITRHFADKTKNEKELPASKYKRTIADDKELFGSASIPHAYSTVRSNNRDTKFPTVDHMLKQKDKESDADLMTPQAVARLGTNQDDHGGGAVAEIRRLQQEEDLLFMNKRSTSVFPGSQKEIEYEREVDRMGRLRTLADQTLSKRRIKEGDLQKLVHQFNNRIEEDEYVLAGLASGESAIVHMESRFVALKGALGQARRLDTNYQMLIDFLQANPPFKDRHLQALEQETVLARTQLMGMLTFRRKLYMETDLKGATRRTNLRNKTMQYKKLRKELLVKKARTQRKIEQVEQQLKDEDQLKAKRDMARLGLVYDENSSDFLESIARGGVQASQASTEGDASTHDQVKKKLEVINEAGKLFSNLGHGANPEEVKALAKKRQAKMTYDFVMQRSGSHSEDQFIERFLDTTRLTESLVSQQHLAESKVSSARAEQDDLHEETMTLLGEAGGVAEQSLEMATRHFDQKMFDAEIRLGQNARQSENATLMINEIRSGVQHIINTLQANSKLLQALPASSPPYLEGDEDIARGLSWCEERVLAINEALVLDNAGSKAQGGVHADSSNNSIYDRQTSLAHAVQNMLTKSPGGKAKRAKRPAAKSKKGHRNISHSIIDFSEESASVISPRGILVHNTDARPALYNSSVGAVEAKRDAFQDSLEAKSKAKKNSGMTGSVQKFLTEGLASHESKEALRKANWLSGKVQGPSSGYGTALSELLKSKGPELSEEHSAAEVLAANAKMKVFKLEFDVPSRDELKTSAAARQRKSLKAEEETKDVTLEASGVTAK
jgi:hypothetical protein